MSKVSIVPCASYDKEKVYKAVQKAISDIDFEIKPKSNVVLKPNVLTNKKPEQAVTTHPAVIEAVCRILKEKNCSITIADSSGVYSTLKNFETSGIAEAGRKYGARLVSLSHEKLIVKKIPDAKILKETRISRILFDADLVINMPKMKTHVLTKTTGGVKNLFGCIPGALKQSYHVKAPSEKKFCQLLVDIYSLVKPQLSIMDGIVGMDGNGPVGGNIRKIGLILASDDAAALDYAMGKITGIEDVYTTRFAVARGFINPDSIEIKGKIKNVRFKQPATTVSFVPSIFKELFFKYTSLEPYVMVDKCTKCGTCAKVCQSKAIKLGPYPVFDRKKCIHCYCCHELCPYKAIDLKRKPIMELVVKIREKLF